MGRLDGEREGDAMSKQAIVTTLEVLACVWVAVMFWYAVTQ